jgi:hypothetical protein
MLRSGADAMWLRYPLAVGVAYLVFLALLWLWLRSRAEDYAGGLDLPGSGSASSSGHDAGLQFEGAGGHFAGGGASGSFDMPADDLSLIDGDSSPIGDALGSATDADEFALPLVALILLGVAVFSSLFMVYSAPTLFAELLVDGVLSASLYRRLRGLETRHWLETAIRRTAGPFALTAALMAACGGLMAHYAPGAHSIGDVITHAS